MATSDDTRKAELLLRFKRETWPSSQAGSAGQAANAEKPSEKFERMAILFAQQGPQQQPWRLWPRLLLLFNHRLQSTNENRGARNKTILFSHLNQNHL